MNFIELIQKNASECPDNIAISHKGNTITYQNLYKGMRQVVSGAFNNGIGTGSNVLFACQPDIESLTVALGLIASGATLSIIDVFCSDDLFLNRASRAGVTHVITDPILYTIVQNRKLAQKLLKKPIADFRELGVPRLALGRRADAVNVRSWFNHEPTDKHEVVTGNHEAIIVFTSGTTSEPKGVVHTLNSLSAHIDDFSRMFKMKPGSRVYSEPMTLGLIALSSGGTWIIPAGEKKIPSCDVWFGTPVEILNGLPKSRDSRINIIATGSAPVLPSLVEQIDALHPEAEILCVYGMTEILPIAVGDARLKKNHTDGDYIGKPLPKTKVEVRDGEVYVGGEALMDRYIGYTKTDMIPTGDYGKLLPDGEIVLLGRKKDMYIRGDMNVYPSLYEPAVSTIPGVNEVVLIGIPDRIGDDELVLVVTPRAGVSKMGLKARVEKEMVKLFDAKAIPSEVLVMDELPRSGRANKPDRQKTVELVKNGRKR